MGSLVPKHKASEKLHAELKTKLSAARDDDEKEKRVRKKPLSAIKFHFCGSCAMEVLESVAIVESRRVVKTLSQGSAEMWPTQEAKAALARLAVRASVRT